MHLRGCLYSHDQYNLELKAAEQHLHCLMIVVRSRLTVLTAGHSSEMGGCVSGYMCQQSE